MSDVLKAQARARFKLTRNANVLHDQNYVPSEIAYTESAEARIVISTNSGWQQFNMEGIVTGGNLMIESDRPILVALGTTALYWPVGSGTKGGAILLSGSAYTNIYVQNESTTNLATIELAATD